MSFPPDTANPFLHGPNTEEKEEVHSHLENHVDFFFTGKVIATAKYVGKAKPTASIPT